LHGIVQPLVDALGRLGDEPVGLLGRDAVDDAEVLGVGQRDRC
jgi:hypothetical protein